MFVFFVLKWDSSRTLFSRPKGFVRPCWEPLRSYWYFGGFFAYWRGCDFYPHINFGAKYFNFITPLFFNMIFDSAHWDIIFCAVIWGVLWISATSCMALKFSSNFFFFGSMPGIIMQNEALSYHSWSVKNLWTIINGLKRISLLSFMLGSESLRFFHSAEWRLKFLSWYNNIYLTK